MLSQYRSIQGIKYERELLDYAESTIAGGRSITKEHATKIWDMALDGNRVTPTERRTVEYIVENFKMNEAAKALLKANLSGDVQPARVQRKGSSYYRSIDGVSYDRKLLEDAESLAAKRGGFLSFDDAVLLYGKASD